MSDSIVVVESGDDEVTYLVGPPLDVTPVVVINEGIPGARGPAGASAELRVDEDEVQWRVGDEEWRLLVPLADITGEDGVDGAEVSMRTSGTLLQWRIGGAAWEGLYDLATLRGEDGAEVGLRVADGQIQWRLGDGAWANLVELSTLRGEDGAEVGLQVADGQIQWRLGDGAWANLISLISLRGADGEPVEMRVEDNVIQWRIGDGGWADLIEVVDGSRLPDGGNEGQILSKASDDDGDYEWIDLPEAEEYTPPLNGISASGTSGGHNREWVMGPNVAYGSDNGSNFSVSPDQVTGARADVSRTWSVASWGARGATENGTSWLIGDAEWPSTVSIKVANATTSIEITATAITVGGVEMAWPDEGGVLATRAWVEANASGGGPAEHTLTLSGVSGAIDVALPQFCTVSAVQLSGAARFRLYRTADGRTLDQGRATSELYPGNLGMLYSVATESALLDLEAPWNCAWAPSGTTLYGQVDADAPVDITITYWSA